MLLVIILSMNAPGLIAYGVAYYELEPPYICQYAEPTRLQQFSSLTTQPNLLE